MEKISEWKIKWLKWKLKLIRKQKSISVHGHNNKKGKQVVYLLTERSKKFMNEFSKNNLINSERKQIKIQLKSWWNEFCKINWKYSLLVKIWSCGGISDGEQ